MEGDSTINVTLEKDKQLSLSDKERVDGDKVDEQNVGGLGDEEVETPKAGMVFSSPEESPKTNCKAKINVALGSDEKFHLCHVVLEHNHELSPGMLHSNRCKKSVGTRAQRRSKAKDPAEAIVHQDYHSLVDVPPGYETIPSVGGVNFTKQLANGDKHLLCPNTGHPTSESMLNHLKRRNSVLENSQNSQDVFKLALAKRAVELVKSGMVIGLCTGSTSLVIEELGRLISEGKETKERRFQMKLYKIAWAATIYHTWLQRNTRIHSGNVKIEGIFRAIRDDVRRVGFC
uniref:FAR1 domain-containing protein n=1 Tax=Fagus sylvatica TaxID=28930 RepID=A0A2N9J425_FAGSY